MPHMQMFCETKAQQPSEFSDDGMQMTRLFHENGNVFVLMLLFPNKIKGKKCMGRSRGILFFVESQTHQMTANPGHVFFLCPIVPCPFFVGTPTIIQSQECSLGDGYDNQKKNLKVGTMLIDPSCLKMMNQ